jgi:spindle assembly abnormal protein 6
MEAEKQICHTKKRALQIATDELAKNHDSIKHLEKTVEKLKNAIDWRTLVMMRMSEENHSHLLNVEQCGIKQQN